MSEVQQFHEETIKTWHKDFGKILPGTFEDFIEVLKADGIQILPGKAGEDNNS